MLGSLSEEATKLINILIFMDVQMPEMNRYEAIRQIRNHPKHSVIPIIAMTAYAMSSDREKCLEAEINDYIAKPVPLIH